MRENKVYNTTLAFISIGLALAIAKFFQETLYLMSYFMEKDFNTSSSILYQSAKYQPLGVAFGYVTTAFFVDKFGVKRILSLTMLLLCLTLLGFSYNTSLANLLFYRIYIGFCIGTIYNCSFGGLTVIFNDQELPKKTSLLYIFAFVSTVIGPQLLTISESYITWRTLLICISLLTLTTSYLTFKYFPTKTESITNYLAQVKTLIHNKTFCMMIIVSTLCMGGFYGFITLLINNLQHFNVPTDAAKFIVADIQFIGRLILLCVTLVATIKLTKQIVNHVLKAALFVMGIASIGLLLLLITKGSVFGNNLPQIIALSINKAHVFTSVLSSVSGLWLFWLYASLIGFAQPANKSKALGIAGKRMSGTAQAIIGFSLSVGEFIFAIITPYHWPYGSYIFLIFTFLSSIFITFRLNSTTHIISSSSTSP